MSNVKARLFAACFVSMLVGKPALAESDSQTPVPPLPDADGEYVGVKASISEMAKASDNVILVHVDENGGTSIIEVYKGMADPDAIEKKLAELSARGKALSPGMYVFFSNDGPVESKTVELSDDSFVVVTLGELDHYPYPPRTGRVWNTPQQASDSKPDLRLSRSSGSSGCKLS